MKINRKAVLIFPLILAAMSLYPKGTSEEETKTQEQTRTEIPHQIPENLGTEQESKLGLEKITLENNQITGSLNSRTSFKSGNQDIDYSRHLNLSWEEGREVAQLVYNEVARGEINSYEGLISKSEEFSLNQKLNLLTRIGYLSGFRGYDLEYMKKDLMNKNEFFDHLQKILNKEEVSLGVCAQIHYYLERLAESMDMKSSSVGVLTPEGLHAITISRIDENRTALIDYSRILIGGNNIEDLLKTYQEQQKVPKFSYKLNDDNKYVYDLITKGGREFMYFSGSNESSEDLRKILTLEKGIKKGFNLNTESGAHLDSISASYFWDSFGISGGYGVMENIPGINKADLLKLGIFESLLFKNGFNIETYLNFVSGFPDRESETEKDIHGLIGKISGFTNNEKGVNFGLEIGVSEVVLSNSLLGIFNPYNGVRPLQNYSAGLGISYSGKMGRKDHSFIPYLIMNSPNILSRRSDNSLSFNPSEITIGAKFIFNLGKSTLSLNPRYTKHRRSAEEVGAEIEYSIDNFTLGADGSINRTTYIFAPDRYSASISVSTEIGDVKIKGSLEGEITDWSGERDAVTNLNLNVRY